MVVVSFSLMTMDQEDLQEDGQGSSNSAEFELQELDSPGAGPLIDEDTLDALQSAKCTMPGLFVSGWDVDDDEGVTEKDMMDPGEQFLTAAEDGDLDSVKKMYEERPDLLLARDSDRYSALHRAAYNNHADVVEYLLSIGADVHWRTENGWTPLHCAACWGSDKVIPVLLKHGADANTRSNGELTALHLAVACVENCDGATSCVKQLLQVPGIESSVVSGAGDTALDIAKRSSKAMTQILEDHFANLKNSEIPSCEREQTGSSHVTLNNSTSLELGSSSLTNAIADNGDSNNVEMTS